MRTVKFIIVGSGNMAKTYSDIISKNPITKLHLIEERIDLIFNNLHKLLNERLKIKRSLVEKLFKNIEILNPLSILDRGYAIILNNKGLAVKSSNEVANKEVLKARLSKGSLDIEVIKKNE